MNLIIQSSRALKRFFGIMMMGSMFLSGVAFGQADKIAFCHLQKKVDPTLVFNDGIVIEVSKAACKAHCGHGDQPMPVPLDNNGHPNRACGRIHVVNGLPECEVNTPTGDGICSFEQCMLRCENT